MPCFSSLISVDNGGPSGPVGHVGHISHVVLFLFLLILNEQLKAGWKMAAAETILCRRSLVLGSFEV